MWRLGIKNIFHIVQNRYLTTQYCSLVYDSTEGEDCDSLFWNNTLEYKMCKKEFSNIKKFKKIVFCSSHFNYYENIIYMINNKEFVNNGCFPESEAISNFMDQDFVIIDKFYEKVKINIELPYVFKCYENDIDVKSYCLVAIKKNDFYSDLDLLKEQIEFLINNSKIDIAKLIITDALKIYINEVSLYNYAGIIAIKNENFDEAAFLFNKAFKINSEDLDAIYNLSYSLIMKNEKKIAKQLIQNTIFKFKNIMNQDVLESYNQLLGDCL